MNNIDFDNLKAQASESSLKPAWKADIKNTHINIVTGHDVTIKNLASLTPQQAAQIVNFVPDNLKKYFFRYDLGKTDKLTSLRLFTFLR